MTNGGGASPATSDYQVIAGNKDDAGSADCYKQYRYNENQCKLGLKAGGVFDWEITDFDGNNGRLDRGLGRIAVRYPCFWMPQVIW